MTDNNCPVCSTPNPQGSRYCTDCGTALAGQSGPLQRGQNMHGRYTVLRSLGKGGMGALYLASETIASQERLVVIKEMLEYYEATDPHGETKAVKRFDSEAAALARLSIAGCPQIFDYFREAGRDYIVMQYIQGKNLESGLTHIDDLGQTVAGQPYPVELVRRWGIQLCKVLEGLAAQDVVHMDIKPANLIVDDAGDVWLVDFGTAKAQPGQDTGGAVGLEKSSVYGTLGYAPPEQAAGNPETRSDVYALAATLYHLLTDDDPRRDPYGFSRLNQLPPDLQAALQAGLAFRVDERSTSRQLAASLGNNTTATTTTTTNTLFRWQDGSATNVPKDLTSAANRNWEEARGYFNGEAWGAWFQDLHRFDLVTQMRDTKAQIQDPDLALDAFLRILDPSLEPPGLHLPAPVLEAGVQPWQKQVALELDIFNLGGGCLQGRFIDVPAGVKPNPAQFSTHEWQRIKITLDTGELSPSPKQQTLFLGIDAGQGGKKYLPLTVTIPEPKLKFDRNQVELGEARRGESALGSLRVANQGASTFMAEIVSQSAWLKPEPERFLCLPGQNKTIQIHADSQGLKSGDNTGRVTVSARAGNWSQTAQVPVRWTLAADPVFGRDWSFRLGGVLVMSIYGGIFGVILGLFTAITFESITTTLGALLAGAMTGMFIALPLGAVFGAIGRINRKSGRQGLRAGLRTAVGVGILVGGLLGVVLEWFFSGVGFALIGLPALNIFGALVGAGVGAAMALFLGWRGS